LIATVVAAPCISGVVVIVPDVDEVVELGKQVVELELSVTIGADPDICDDISVPTIIDKDELEVNVGVAVTIETGEEVDKVTGTKIDVMVELGNITAKLPVGIEGDPEICGDVPVPTIIDKDEYEASVGTDTDEFDVNIGTDTDEFDVSIGIDVPTETRDEDEDVIGAEVDGMPGMVMLGKRTAELIVGIEGDPEIREEVPSSVELVSEELKTEEELVDELMIAENEIMAVDELVAEEDVALGVSEEELVVDELMI
jgi:hypothetical protein